MAAADSADTLEPASNRAIFFDRLDKVRTAGRRVPAIASQQWADADLVHPDPENQNVAGQAN